MSKLQMLLDARASKAEQIVYIHQDPSSSCPTKLQREQGEEFGRYHQRGLDRPESGVSQRHLDMARSSFGDEKR